jgi:hypothetical protein
MSERWDLCREIISNNRTNPHALRFEFSDPQFFPAAFSRLFLHFSEIPLSCRRYLSCCLVSSLRAGPVREHPLEIVKLRTSTDAVEWIMDRIRWTYPDSLSRLDVRQLRSFFQTLVRIQLLPRSALELRLLTRSWVIFHFKQILCYFELCRSQLFDYFAQLPVIDQSSFWISNFNELSNISSEHLISIVWHFLLALLRCPEMQSLIESTRILAWCDGFVGKIRESGIEIPLFGIILLILRSFDTVAKLAVEQCNLAQGVSISLTKIRNPRYFAETFFWAIDPTRECPFLVLLDEVDSVPQFPPPSPIFTTRIIPKLLKILVNRAGLDRGEFLQFIVIELSKMYDQHELFPILCELSNPSVLMPIMPLIVENAACREFVARALGLSCCFPVFRHFYAAVSSDLSKTVTCFAIMSKYTQLVTDFGIVTSEFSIPLTARPLTIVFWVRPLTDTHFLSLASKQNELLRFRLSLSALYGIEVGLQVNESIRGWMMISVGLSESGLIGITGNLSSCVVNLSFDASQLDTLKMGGYDAYFWLQSIQTFKSALTSHDLAFLFATGPTVSEFAISSLLDMSEKCPTFVSPTGFVSKPFLPFISHYQVGEQFDKSCLRYRDSLFGPPFRSLQNVHRCSFWSYLNSLYCHGGMFLLLHLAAEVILKAPELNKEIWSLFGSLLDVDPRVNLFLETIWAYPLIGHLLWSGNTPADFTIALALGQYRGHFFVTNPLILRDWLFRAQINFTPIRDPIVALTASLNEPWNFKNLRAINAFELIINVLCGSSSHPASFLQILGDFAIALTTKMACAETPLLLTFHSILTDHLKFARDQQLKVSECNTCHMLYILRGLLCTFPEFGVELELFIPAIVLATSAIQIPLVSVLLEFVKVDFLVLFSAIFLHLPHVQEFGQPLFLMITDRIAHLSFARLAAAWLYFIGFSENLPFLESFCCLASLEIPFYPDHLPILLTLLLTGIQISESNDQLKKIDSFQSASKLVVLALYKTMACGRADHFRWFFIGVATIPDIGLHRLSTLALFLLDRVIRLIFECPITPSFGERLIDFSASWFVYLLQTIRLTPGFFFDSDCMQNLTGVADCLLTYAGKLNTNEALQPLIPMLIALFQVELPSDFIGRIRSAILDTAKFSKLKNFRDLCERVDTPDCLTFPLPCISSYATEISQADQAWAQKWNRESTSLFSLCCSSIHIQAKHHLWGNFAGIENEYVISIWCKIFRILHFPGSGIFQNCPPKWVMANRSSSYQQRLILEELNPAIDRHYLEFWSAKYSDPVPTVRLTFREVLRYTSLSFQRHDDIRFSCVGSRLIGIMTIEGIIVVSDTYFRFYQKSSEFSDDFLILPLSRIRSIRLRTNRHQPTAIEISEKSNCYLLVFDTPTSRDWFAEVVSNLGVKIIPTVDLRELESLTKRWIDYGISNFEYLLALNFASGRSWMDLTQYPIFPWVLKNYTTPTLDLSDHSNYRDLTYPLFAQSQDQRTSCLDYFQTTSTLGSDPHCSPNFISNVGSTLYYLVRMEPFTTEEIRFQGSSLDSPDRTCRSLEITYNLMTCPANRNSLELVPECYFSPDVFLNVNRISFPMSRNGELINHVALPTWARSARDCVGQFRAALESLCVSRQLHEFIDLVWGFRRRGQPALDRCNVFQSTVFEFDQNVMMIDMTLYAALADQVYNCGQAPHQLFKTAHPKRAVIDQKQVRGILKRAGNRHRPLFKSIRPRGPELWVALPPDLTHWKELKFLRNKIEGKRINGTVVQLLTFSEDIGLTCWAIAKQRLVTGHSIPIVNVWVIGEHLTFERSLFGHLSSVSVISVFGKPWKLIAVGHDDGTVSLFSKVSYRFLRRFEPKKDSKVLMVKIVPSTGDLLIAQKGLLTLRTINGELVQLFQFPDLIDVVFPSHSGGGELTNVAFLLIERAIMAVSTFDFEIICEVSTEKENPVALTLGKGEKTLTLSYADGSSLTFNIE